eukprot:scaffold6778_cov115-Skeletonema_marinoi.AAC.2
MTRLFCKDLVILALSKFLDTALMGGIQRYVVGFSKDKQNKATASSALIVLFSFKFGIRGIKIRAWCHGSQSVTYLTAPFLPQNARW